jgi:hypothetical protein
MTYDEAVEYVEHAIQSESEQRAEYGMGAVSLGYDPYEWSSAYDGYRTSDDSTYAEAVRIIKEHDQRPCPGCGVMGEPYAPCGSEQCRIKDNDEDIPF